MTLIDKADALEPCPFCGGEAELWNASDNRHAWIACMGRCAVLISKEHTTDAEAIAAWNRRAALPARGVGVKPLVWEETSGVWTAKTIIGEYTVCFDDGLWCELSGPDYWDWQAPEDPRSYSGPYAAQLAAQADYEARILAALEPSPTDAAHVNKTPKSEHDAGNVLTAAQAREAALAVAKALDAWADVLRDGRQIDASIIGLRGMATTVRALIGERP